MVAGDDGGNHGHDSRREEARYFRRACGGCRRDGRPSQRANYPLFSSRSSAFTTSRESTTHPAYSRPLPHVASGVCIPSRRGSIRGGSRGDTTHCQGREEVRRWLAPGLAALQRASTVSREVHRHGGRRRLSSKIAKGPKALNHDTSGRRGSPGRSCGHPGAGRPPRRRSQGASRRAGLGGPARSSPTGRRSRR